VEQAVSDTNRKVLILLTVADLVVELLDEGRCGDEELGRGDIEEAIEAGEVSVNEIVAAFRKALKEAL
jgi:hypothetical protein